MKRDSRLSITLHLLIHMADMDRPHTSEELGAKMMLNPVVVRRTLAGLREAGFLRAEKGHGGGWTLARSLADISLGDVHEALGTSSIFALGVRTESPGCVVERAVNRAMKAAFADAEEVLMKRLHGVSLAEVRADVQKHAPGWHLHHPVAPAKKATRRKRETRTT
ncbi:MAG TPA: Rrf2 family transcriptional regulator [Polyangiaceae bacterium]